MSDLRSKLSKLLDGIEDEALKALIEETFEAKRFEKVSHPFTCKHCHKQQLQIVQVEVPARISERVKALEILMNQGHGKPAETKKVEVDISISTVEELRALPTAELARLAAIEDADFRELPAGS